MQDDTPLVSSCSIVVLLLLLLLLLPLGPHPLLRFLLLSDSTRLLSLVPVLVLELLLELRSLLVPTPTPIEAPLLQVDTIV